MKSNLRIFDDLTDEQKDSIFNGNFCDSIYCIETEYEAKKRLWLVRDGQVIGWAMNMGFYVQYFIKGGKEE